MLLDLIALKLIKVVKEWIKNQYINQDMSLMNIILMILIVTKRPIFLVLLQQMVVSEDKKAHYLLIYKNRIEKY